MKKIVPFGLVLAIVGVLSSFNLRNENGNIITLDDGITYYWRADNCSAPYVPALTQRTMSSSKGFYMVDVTFQLPPGHCDIPERGTTVTRYTGENQRAVIHSDGFVQGKIMVKPN